MRKILFTVCSLIIAGCAGTQKPAIPVYLDASQPIEERIEDALSRMTLHEKIGVLHAQSKFSSRGVQRLGIPELWTTDGPHGIRPEVLWDEWDQAGWGNDSCVAFPALTCLAATWNTDMSLLYGKSIGEEARYREKDVLLGPGVNINRTPLCGRNFEYMGEDPYLSGQMVVPYIKGVQANGVATCVKHYAVNNHEFYRTKSNSVVDDRALYEIYLPAFKAAVQEGGTWTIMASYNLYKNQQVCHNKYLLNDILKGEWGFDGAVVSDWGGAHDTKEAALYGLDLEYGTWTDGLTGGASDAYERYFLARPYEQMIESGELGTKELDDKVRRVLRLIFRTAMNPSKPFGSLCSDEHYEAARRIGDEGIVLLRNENEVLPIDLASTKRILVVGENAIKMMTVGGGSSSLKVQHEITPLEGIRAFVGDRAEVRYARGYVGDVSGEYNRVVARQNLAESRSAEELTAEALREAEAADYVIYIGGLNKSSLQDSEGCDRLTIELPYGQDALIEALAAVNKNLVVVNISGSGVAMPWVEQVPAILQAWYLGSECGNSMADVLFGAVNPSGKLPCTFPEKIGDVGAHATNGFPAVVRPDSDIRDMFYNESILVGYRWFDTKQIKPLFAFGHGLSYTTFAYGDAKINKQKINADGTVKVTVKVTNTGKRAGAEVVQLYVADPEASVLRPAKELKGFKKVYLEAGESRDVTFTLDRKALSYFDDQQHAWVAEPGTFEVLIGSASDDIRTSCKFDLTTQGVDRP